MGFKTHPHYASELIQIDDYSNDGYNKQDEDQAQNHEIEFVRSGTFMRYDAFGKTVIDSNHVVFFNRNQPYQITHPVGGDHSTIFTISDDTLYNLLRTHDLSTDNQLDFPFPMSHAPLEATHQLLLVQLLHALSHSENLASLALDEHILLLLGDILARTYQRRMPYLREIPSTTRSIHIELVNNVKVALSRTFYTTMSLNEIAQTVYTSPYHLCRIFRQVTGQTLHKYIQHLRLYHALEQIAFTHKDDFMSLALDLGFSSHSHFSTVFARTFGMTPSAFRKTINANSLTELSKILKV